MAASGVKGRTEIVIGSDVGANGNIEADGTVCVFVGGHFSGAITSDRILEAWIHGNLAGEIRTGRQRLTKLEASIGVSGMAPAYYPEGQVIGDARVIHSTLPE